VPIEEGEEGGGGGEGGEEEKYNPFYLKTQSVPRSKHLSPRL
jgi:hypothetical protein